MHQKQEDANLDAPNPLLQAFFSIFSVAFSNHHAWRPNPSLYVHGTVVLLGRLANGHDLLSGCHVVGLY